MRAFALVLLGMAVTEAAAAPDPAPKPHAKAVKVTILSTMLSGAPGAGIGEWGFAALVEVDGRRILVDTGSRPETVLQNAAELKVDLSNVLDVVLTHSHDDHTGGLITLRRELRKKNATALGRAHVGVDFFAVRIDDEGKVHDRAELRKQYEALGGVFVEHAAPKELMPNVWITGPVPRVNKEQNWSALGKIRRASGLVEDTVPEDSSLIVDMPEGLLVVTGCGHAGIVNIAEYAAKFRNAKINAVIGGLHLFPATDAQLTFTGQKLKALGVALLIGAHCTGIEAVFRLRELLGLKRGAAVVGMVGASYERGKGITPLGLAR